jgi:hypothetical protein
MKSKKMNGYVTHEKFTTQDFRTQEEEKMMRNTMEILNNGMEIHMRKVTRPKVN